MHHRLNDIDSIGTKYSQKNLFHFYFFNNKPPYELRWNRTMDSAVLHATGVIFYTCKNIVLSE